MRFDERGRPKDPEELASLICVECDIEGVDVPPELWASLTKTGLVHRSLDTSDQGGVPAAIQYAKRWLKKNPKEFVRARPPAKVRADLPSSADFFTEAEAFRARVLSDHLVARAGARKDVLDLRADLFQGRLLSESEAAGVVESKVLSHLPLREIRQLGIPILGHESRLVEADGGPALSPSETALIHVSWPGGECSVPYRMYWYFDAAYWVQQLHFPAQGGGHGTQRVMRNSVLDDIRQSSVTLAKALPWEEHEALAFLLTGATPASHPIRVQVAWSVGAYSEQARIHLSIDPFTSADSVYSTYQEIQRRIGAMPAKPLDPTLVRLYHFVRTQVARSKTRPRWEQLRKAWNSKQKHGHTFDDFRRFRRDYKRAEKRFRQLVFPHFPIGRAHEPQQLPTRPIASASSAARQRTRGGKKA